MNSHTTPNKRTVPAWELTWQISGLGLFLLATFLRSDILFYSGSVLLLSHFGYKTFRERQDKKLLRENLLWWLAAFVAGIVAFIVCLK